jgi:hypothetical protein
VGSGDRSQRIRTYNFPQGRVTDHRINLTLHKLDAVLDGVALGERPHLTASLLGSYGSSLWQAGTSHLVGHPRVVVQWAFYQSPLTGRGGPDARLARFLTSSNISFNATPFPLEAPPVPAEALPIAVRSLTGSAAERAEIARLRRLFGDSVMDMATTPRATRMKVGAASRFPDARITVADLWEGAVEIVNETKSGHTRFNGRSGGTVALEALMDSAFLSSVSLGRSLVRGLGQAMRGLGLALGLAGGILDVAATVGEIRFHLALGDLAGAGWAGTGLLGRWTGLLAGAAWGAEAGPVGALVGGFLGAFYGGRAVDLIEAIATYGQSAHPAPGFTPAFDEWAFAPPPLAGALAAAADTAGEALRRELRDCSLMDYWGAHRESWQPRPGGPVRACALGAGADPVPGAFGPWPRDPWADRWSLAPHEMAYPLAAGGPAPPETPGSHGPAASRDAVQL